MRSKIRAGREREHQRHFRNDNENAAIAMLRRRPRTHFHVEQMLLATLPNV
jgi:hypothetical protein